MTVARDPQPSLTMETHDRKSIALETHNQMHSPGQAMGSRPTFVGSLDPPTAVAVAF